MKYQIFSVGPLSTNCIVLSQDEEAIIIDPGLGAFEEVKTYCKTHALNPKSIWLTHSHWDHIADLAKCMNHFEIDVYVHESDLRNVQKPGSDQLPLLIPILGVEHCHLLNEGDKLMLKALQLEVIHTPGHSSGSVCLYCKSENLLISGDTLFAGSIGNLSLPTAEPNRMWNSLAKLATLPAETIVIPGHGSITTIGKESWLANAKEIFGGCI